jgi:hypothetical protein
VRREAPLEDVRARGTDHERALPEPT